MALSSQHRLHNMRCRPSINTSTNVRPAGCSARRAAAPAPCRAAAVDTKSVVAELLADIASIPGPGGADTPAEVQARIFSKVEQLKAAQQGSTTTEASTLTATWKLLWTTEKETLFIVKNAPVFGTKAGGVYQASAVHIVAAATAIATAQSANQKGTQKPANHMCLICQVHVAAVLQF